MKTAICTPLDLNKNGGVEKHIICLAQAMREQGLDLDLFGQVESNHSKNTRSFHSLKKFRPQNYHIIHTHSGQFSPRFLKMLLKKKPHQRFVHTMHNSALDYAIACNTWFNWRCYTASAIEAFWGRHANHVIVISQPVRRRAIHFFAIKPEKISLIHNGAAPFHPATHIRKQTREQLNIAEDDCLLLFVGRGEDKVKGSKEITDSMNQLHQKFPNVKLMAVPGAGFAPAPWIRQTGPVDHLEMNNCYAAADIFVNASLDEGLPLTLIEAMAAGLPIVAAPVGGIPEVITHNQTGLLLQPDRSDLTEKLDQLISDNALQTRLGQAAATAAQDLTWENIATQTIATYEAIL